jgi:hypothetical protein
MMEQKVKIWNLFRRKYVPHSLRVAVAKHYPNIYSAEKFARLMQYLLFPGTPRLEDDSIWLDWATLAEIEDVPLTKKYNGGRFLEEYMAVTGHRPEILPYNHKEGLVRRVSALNLHPDVIAEVQHMIPGSTDRIDFVTGKPFDKYAKSKLREEDYRRAMAVQSHVDACNRVLVWLNELPARTFSVVIEAGLASAIERANRYSQEERRGKTRELTRDYALRLLSEIADQPQPFYRVSREGRTLRLIPLNMSLCNLPREIRKLLTTCAGWKTFDLKAAQLAIIAKLWNIPELLAFLESGRSIWTELQEYLGLTPADKDFLKHEAVYPITYGEKRDVVTVALDNAYGNGTGKKFLTHPIIAAILQARTEQLAMIKRDGGAYDCYNNWITPPMDKPFEKAWFTEENYRSVLAQLSQAVEFKLIYAAFAEAQLSKGEASIVLYQYDGFSVKFRRPEAEKKWTQRIMEAVKQEADSLGVLTSLEPEASYAGE